MIEPTGYTALDLIGFTDRGGYDPDAYYVKNDIVTVGNTKWRCLIDDTHNVTPTEGANWTIYLESATSLAGMDDTDIVSPKNGDLIQFNSTSNKWGNSDDVWKTMAQNGAHNLLPNSLTTQVINGVTLTVNSDKSITISGSPTTLVTPIVGTNFTIPKGQYILSGIDSSVTNMMWNAIILLNGASVVHTYTISSTDDFSFDTSAYTYTNIQVSMKRIEDNVACSGTIYPMIRLASDTDPTYAPYAKTNRELTEKVDELYSSTDNKISYIRGYYNYGGTSSNILSMIQAFLTGISITNNIGVIDVVIAGNAPWSVRGYCFSTKDFAVLTAMRYDGSCKLFYRSSSTDTIKDFTTT